MTAAGKSTGRLVLAVLVAGVILNAGEFVLNAVLLESHWTETMDALGVEAIGGASIAWLNVMGFALAFVMVALAALLTERLGSGRRAAAASALVAWLLAYVLGFGWSYAMGVFPGGVYWTTVAWAFFELQLAAFAGAWLLEGGRRIP